MPEAKQARSAVPPAGPRREEVPTPLPARAGPAPTKAGVCDENDRAIPGLKRYRVRAVNAEAHNGYPVGKYVLAPDRDTAVALYVEADADHIRDAGFDVAKREKKGADGATVALNVRVDELPD